MAPSIEREVIISAGTHARRCYVRLDADCWPSTGVPVQIAGSVRLRGKEFEAIAGSDGLLLTLVETGEPYRMILDAASGRFIARQM